LKHIGLNNMKNIKKTFIISIASVLIIMGVYIYFSNGLSVSAEVPISSDSSLVSQNKGSSPSGNESLSLDTSFLASLASLTRIKIDTSLFSNDSFKRLKDNTVKLEQVASGRPNPFAPVNAPINNGIVPFSSIVTNQPVQITNKTAILSGIINNTTGITDTYFEYGTTETLGKVTAKAEPSLIGTFITTINNLN